MGRITSEPQKETLTAITHFGHTHPLIHITTDHQHKITRNISSYSSCSGCNLNIFGTNFYACTECKFFLHKKCFDMPKKIEHPFHKDHALSLVPGPAYSTGNFNCDACFEKGKGFSYNCDPCGIDLNILCAIMPLCVTNATCHPHKLDLTFGSPFLTKRFSCNVCKKLGGDHWLYRCGFQSKDYLEPREVATFSKWAPATPPPVVATLPLMVAPPPLVEKASPPPNVATPPPIVAVVPPVVAVPPNQTQKLWPRPMMESVPCVLPVEVSSVPFTGSGNRHNDDLALFAIQQMITNNSKAIAQAILSAGNSGDIRGFHLLIELIYAISSNSGTSGGGSQDSLHTIKNNGGGSGDDGGGGDGQDSLKMVIDCGSDGGGPDRALHKVIEDSGSVGGQKSLHAVNGTAVVVKNLRMR
ncbi:hypothetical protein MIMGU_mgv1a025308mg [Erythranthe guttata]|uniref:DC1 domain-containing protein n=1 Tax=Erythranthe guttata TaxID=4155 RepID=A0A022QGR5_ERYGU|nr:hypothetical protein MIMGU_mgv1a025308mg [Erythranthe guttata]